MEASKANKNDNRVTLPDGKVLDEINETLRKLFQKVQSLDTRVQNVENGFEEIKSDVRRVRVKISNFDNRLLDIEENQSSLVNSFYKFKKEIKSQITESEDANIILENINKLNPNSRNNRNVFASGQEIAESISVPGFDFLPVDDLI